MEQPIKLIVNADDLGHSTKVNDAIFDLMAKGHITSATLLANGPAVSDAARRLLNYPHCSFGVHLHLTDFRPLTANGELSSLLDGNGCFTARWIRHSPAWARILAAVLEEFSAQVRKLIALGVPISHLDGHRHCHTIPSLFPVLKRLQSRFGIRKVRITQNIYVAHSRPSLGKLFRKALWNCALRRLYATRTTEGFTSLRTLMEVARLHPLRYPTIELMVHPGNPDFEEETGLLVDGWYQDLLIPLRLLSYDAL